MSEKPLVTMRAEGESTGVKTTVHVRDLAPFIVDEPERLGGTDAGPNPLEYLLGALSSCTTIMIAYVAQDQNFDYDGVTFVTEGTLDPRGFQGVEGIRTYFENVHVHIVLETVESDERIAELQKGVEARCPIHNLMHAADVDITATWTRK
ncbi:MAG: OsmC family protein [Exiguobacterium sp.]|uniref:OsmC family protein n=1 Tax=Exiguobacterium sp. AB2 TaxID=1484479 RepID=UPI0004A8A433|nr:OsmC family protein [Exiguobacterium sp. AB2]KDN57990.1 osmotically inducible protein C [Exiguobacterium sp. AB2]MDX5323062.1 OsmC family protein [Exiguobacterium sp.]MDX5424838.1 OsmC family protein [Exiguobacterium sp.]MDX6772294.1 OsmC family protein [Exiguobacterium sp.]